MSLRINVSGTWQYLSKAYVKVSNAWQPCVNIHVNTSGTWRPLYSYWWYTGNWGNCSAGCGGGTQTRQVTCVREHAGESNHGSNWTDIDDACCIKNGLPKPATSQVCNTHSCADCQYNQPGVCYSGVYNTYWSDVEAWNYTFVLWNDDNCSIDGALYNGTLIGAGGTINKNGYIYSRGSLQRQETSGGVLLKDYQVCRTVA